MEQPDPNGSHLNQQEAQGNGQRGQGLDQSHGQPAVPMIHRSVDDILSAEFPPGLGSVQPNDNVHGDYMEGLDDLFNDVPMTLTGRPHYPRLAPASSAIGSEPQQQELQQHQPALPHSQSLPQPLPQTQSQPEVQPQSQPQPQYQQLHQHQQQFLHQNGHGGVSTPGSVFPQLPGHQQQQLHMPSLPPNPAIQTSVTPQIQHTSSVVTLPPSSLPQGPAQTQINLPNGGQSLPTAAPVQLPSVPASTPTPMLAPPQPLIAQAGSPLHKILNSVTPAVGQQLTHLFSLLQTNAVTPTEFLAQAEKLLEPAQFEILDGIRRRHPSGPGGTPGGSPAGSVNSTQSSAIATPGSSSTVSTPAAGVSTPGAGTTNIPVVLPPTRATLPNLPNVATPPFRPNATTTTVMTPSLPPVSSAASQSAPVRKRNTDTTSNAAAAEVASKSAKRLKTEGQAIPTPGVNGSASIGMATPALPSTPGSGAPSPGGFHRVSLPGQQQQQQQQTQRVPATPGQIGAAGQIGASSGIGTPGGTSAPSSIAGPPPSSAAAATATGAGTTSAAKGGGGGGANAANEKVNYDNITDVMGYVGVDLREESDNIMRDNDGGGYSKSGSGADGQDRARVQNFVNVTVLKTRIERIAASHKLTTMEPDVLAYLAMATQERLRSLTEQMIHASKHRGQSQASAVPVAMYDQDHAMYKIGVTQDVKKQLLAIERVEREEEVKRKEMIAERERRAALGEDLDENGDPRPGGGIGGIGGAGGGGGGGAGGGGAGGKKKKQKEGGPGVSARNMTEEARKKVANQTALGFAGGSGRTYSWMMGGGGSGGGSGPGAGAGAGGVSSPMASSSIGAAGASSPAAKPLLTRTATMPAGSSTSGLSGGGGSGSPGASAAGSPSLSRGGSMGGVGGGGGSSMVLPPSTLGRPTSLRDNARKVNVKDALFCLERDRGGGGGEGSGQRVLVKSYVKWLK
ncbi:hypothetical protein BG004_000556 [Podila humilis]|nr:hypothetical protein BG004_000556 [Podila humilis]